MRESALEAAVIDPLSTDVERVRRRLRSGLPRHEGDGRRVTVYQQPTWAAAPSLHRLDLSYCLYLAIRMALIQAVETADLSLRSREALMYSTVLSANVHLRSTGR